MNNIVINLIVSAIDVLVIYFAVIFTPIHTHVYIRANYGVSKMRGFQKKN